MILPIRQNEQYMGLAELSGLLRVEKDFIVLEYNLKDEMLGMFNSDLKVLKIPLHTVEEIHVKMKWFSARFEIHLNRLPKTDKSLSINGNVISFIIKKKEIKKAQSIRSSLMLHISEKRLRELDDDDLNEQDKRDDFLFTTKSQHSTPASGDSLSNMLRDSDS